MFSSRHVRLPVKLQWCMYLHLIRHSISMSQNNTILGLHPAPLFAYRIMCPPPSQLDLAPRVCPSVPTSRQVRYKTDLADCLHSLPQCCAQSTQVVSITRSRCPVPGHIGFLLPETTAPLTADMGG